MGSGPPWARQVQRFDRGTVTSVPRVRSQFPRLLSLRIFSMAAGPLPPPHPVPGGPAVCRDTEITEPHARGVGSGPCPTGSPKRQGLAGSCSGPQPFTEMEGSEVRDPRLAKRRCRAAERRSPSDGGGCPGAPVSRPRAGRGLPFRGFSV